MDGDSVTHTPPPQPQPPIRVPFELSRATLARARRRHPTSHHDKGLYDLHTGSTAHTSTSFNTSHLEPGYLAALLTGGAEGALDLTSDAGTWAVTVEGDGEGMPSRVERHLLAAADGHVRR